MSAPGPDDTQPPPRPVVRTAHQCREALYELQVFLDGECGAVLEQAIAVHLRECRPCFARADFERELRAIIAASCRERAPEGLLDRVVLRLDAEIVFDVELRGDPRPGYHGI